MIYKEKLMIGDWVLYKGYPVCISQLNRETFNTTTFFGEKDGVGYSYDYIEGIHITKELLQKNGFSKDEAYAHYQIDNWHYFQYYYYESRLRRYAKKPGTEGPGGLVFQSHVTYLHELQHALKMNYVEMDIHP